jgi:hypothetical protein
MLDSNSLQPSQRVPGIAKRLRLKLSTKDKPITGLFTDIHDVCEHRVSRVLNGYPGKTMPTIDTSSIRNQSLMNTLPPKIIKSELSAKK